MKTYDELAEEYADQVELDPDTYRGDVVTAFVSGMMKRDELVETEPVELEDLIKQFPGEDIAVITKDEWQQAFYKAEADAVKQFPDERLCETKNKDGDHECALCYMSIQMKKHLGIFQDEEK